MEVFKINELLKEKEITFGQLAESVEISRSNLYNYIAENNTTIAVLIKIANALDVSVADLFNKEESVARGYLELGDKVYVIDSLEDVIEYQNNYTQYIKKNEE